MSTGQLRTFGLDEGRALAHARRRLALTLGSLVLFALGISAATAALKADVPEDFQRSFTGTLPYLLGALAVGSFVAAQQAAPAVRKRASTFLLVVGDHVVRVSARGTPTIVLRRSELAVIDLAQNELLVRAKDGRTIRLFDDVIGFDEIRGRLAAWKTAPVDLDAEAREVAEAKELDPSADAPALAHEDQGQLGWRPVLMSFGRQMIIGWVVLAVLMAVALAILGTGK